MEQIDNMRTVLVGIDWARHGHDVVVTDRDGDRLWQGEVLHSGAGLDGLAGRLTQAGGGVAQSVWIGIEVPHGPVVETMLERGFRVFAINPKQVDRFRDRFSMGGAKDDVRDAETIASALRTDPQAFREVQLAPPLVQEMREYNRTLETLTNDRLRVASRMAEELVRYYPAFLSFGNELWRPWLLALWKRAPATEQARELSESAVESLLRAHRIRKFSAAQILQTLGQQPPSCSPGTHRGVVARIASWVAQLELLNVQISQTENHLSALAEEMGGTPKDASEVSDLAIMRSFPGIGPRNAATLLTEAHAMLDTTDAQQLRAVSGIAPVTVQSGRRRDPATGRTQRRPGLVVMRRARNRRLGNAMYHWGRVAAQRDPIDKARYATLRARGHSHGRACRQIADRLIDVLLAALRTRSLYDPSRRATAARMLAVAL